MDVGFSTAVKKLGTVGCTVRIMRPEPNFLTRLKFKIEANQDSQS